MRKTQAQKSDLFYKRIARARRMCNGNKHPLDRRQMRRALRILSLTQAYLSEDAPEIKDVNRTYRKAINRI